VFEWLPKIISVLEARNINEKRGETAALLVKTAATALAGRGAPPKRLRFDDAPLPPLTVCFDNALNAAMMEVLKLTVRGSFWAPGSSSILSPASL
jgi:hypothetical protein